jgi:hypothetical protein
MQEGMKSMIKDNHNIYKHIFGTLFKLRRVKKGHLNRNLQEQMEETKYIWKINRNHDRDVGRIINYE